MRVLLVEPYLGGSHRAWAEGYARRSRHQVTVLSHEARFWKWRLQGAGITLADRIDGDHDVVFASSMLDLARFLGAARRRLGLAPAVAFFHESQFSYPRSPRDREDLTYAMTNWVTAAVADAVVFNSEFHRRVFLEGAELLLGRFPDHRHLRLLPEMARRTAVLPVGVDLARLERRVGSRDADPLVMWNHRWEHDKDPGAFVRLLVDLVGSGASFRVAVCGERFVSSPPCVEELPGLLGARLVHLGYADEATYRDLLAEAEVVVSTARQEFFGVAIVEAMWAGAFPVLPRRLVYPERIPSDLHGRCLYRDHRELVCRVVWALRHREEAGVLARRLGDAQADFDWSAVAPRYDALLEDVGDEPQSVSSTSSQSKRWMESM